MKITQKIVLVLGYNRFLVPDDWTYEDIEKYCHKTLALVLCDYDGTLLDPNWREKVEIIITTSRSDVDDDDDDEDTNIG
jgi:hypothetical protein